MADKIKYNGTGDGYSDKGVHFIDGVKDYTLCGLTLDGDEDTAGGFDATKEKVDCEECIRIVKYCKSIRNSEMKEIK